VAHETDFHQFMLYTPVPGTPLFEEMTAAGRMLPDVDLADIHGQFKFNFAHLAISRDQSKTMLDAAFRRDYERNGPSIFRICQTTLQGWMRYKDHPDSRVRERFRWESSQLRGAYNAALWAMEHRLAHTNRELSQRIAALRGQVEAEFGGAAKWARRLAGPMMLWSAWREEHRLAAGKTYEPRPVIDRRHWAAS
jgi:hypothetical protein